MKKALIHSTEIIKEIEQAGGFILMLDFDGTLAPIASEPKKAKISAPASAILEALKFLVPIAVISGRQLDDVIQKVGVANIAYAGNHGFEWKIDSTRNAKKVPQQEINALARVAKNLQILENKFNGLHVEYKNYTIAVHFRSVKKKLLDALRIACNQVLNPFIQKGLLISSEGRRVLDITPNMNWNKGSCARMLYKHLSSGYKIKLVPIFIGDDATDESIFVELREGITIRVGWNSNSAATYFFHTRSEVESFLMLLLKLGQEIKTSRV